MKKIALPFLLFLCSLNFIQAQQAHLKLIHDFDGNDFDWSVIGMVGVNDSLYVISFTPNRHGMFFRIDGNGDGYKVIWEFDDVHFEPTSIARDNNSIYITTRLGTGGGGLFKYSLADHSFKHISAFGSEYAEPNIEYVTDSLLWFTSQWSSEDEGSVFTTKRDGTDAKKIYSATNPTENARPVNFFFHKNKIYVACWGGGNLVEGTYAGNFIRINHDGSGYEKIIPGNGDIGTQPQSLVFRDDKMIGLFAYGGAEWKGKVFRSNLDGSDYEPLGSVGARSLTNFLSTQSLIYGVTTFAIYGVNPHNGKIRMYDDFQSNPDFGVDVVSTPVYLNGDVFITAQQGGPNGGGTILKWLNARPEVHVPENPNHRTASVQEINLHELFIDPNEDLLTYEYDFDEAHVTLTESNGILTLTPLTADPTEVKVTATDGWAGYARAIIQLNPFEITIEEVDEAEEVEVKSEQSIEFNSLISKKYGDIPFTLSASASSTLPVTFESSDNSIVSIIGNNATILKAGTVTITARQNGGEYFHPAEPVSRELVVQKANQEISFTEIPPMQSDASDFNLVASASSSLPISFNSSNVSVATVSGTTVSIVAPGTTLITASQTGNENYVQASPVSRLLTVELVTGIAPGAEAFTVFPNPTDGHIQINGNIKDFMLVDMLGGTINHTVDRTNNGLDVSSLPAGVYLLKIAGPSSTNVVRIVKK